MHLGVRAARRLCAPRARGAPPRVHAASRRCRLLRLRRHLSKARLQRVSSRTRPAWDLLVWGVADLPGFYYSNMGFEACVSWHTRHMAAPPTQRRSTRASGSRADARPAVTVMMSMARARRAWARLVMGLGWS